jgi:hypothetical protein
MKFSELDKEEWFNLQPYLDTCLIPVSGIAGGIAPWEMAELAASAGAWLLPLEKAFAGRTVTLPAYHYYDGSPEAIAGLRRLCAGCREAGFRHVVLVSGIAGLLPEDAGADLCIQPQASGEMPDPEALHHAMTGLWTKSRSGREGTQEKNE